MTSVWKSCCWARSLTGPFHTIPSAVFLVFFFLGLNAPPCTCCILQDLICAPLPLLALKCIFLWSDCSRIALHREHLLLVLTCLSGVCIEIRLLSDYTRLNVTSSSWFCWNASAAPVGEKTFWLLIFVLVFFFFLFLFWWWQPLVRCSMLSSSTPSTFFFLFPAFIASSCIFQQPQSCCVWIGEALRWFLMCPQ